MIHDEIVTYEVAKLAKDKGFDVYCDYTYYNHYRVRDEIQTKHPDLSDDGYEDLRKIYGGPYYDNELYGYYIEALALHSKNSTIGINPITKKPCATNAICAAPTQSILQRWLREEKGIIILVNIGYCYENEDLPFYMNPNMEPIFNGYYYGIWRLSELNNSLTHSKYFPTYELALEDALRHTLENLV